MPPTIIVTVGRLAPRWSALSRRRRGARTTLLPPDEQAASGERGRARGGREGQPASLFELMLILGMVLTPRVQ